VQANKNVVNYRKLFRLQSVNFVYLFLLHTFCEDILDKGNDNKRTAENKVLI